MIQCLEIRVLEICGELESHHQLQVHLVFHLLYCIFLLLDICHGMIETTYTAVSTPR